MPRWLPVLSVCPACLGVLSAHETQQSGKIVPGYLAVQVAQSYPPQNNNNNNMQ